MDRRERRRCFRVAKASHLAVSWTHRASRPHFAATSARILVRATNGDGRGPVFESASTTTVAVTVGRGVLALIDTDILRVEGYFEETKHERIHLK